jgi:membrane-bound serine protease (ClpP class)
MRQGVDMNARSIVNRNRGILATLTIPFALGALLPPPVAAATGQPVAGGLVGFLADPNIAFVLFVAGCTGLVIELVNPSILAGVTGAICLILAFIGFGSLPLNVGGLLLVVAGMILLGLETQITSHGLLGLGGVVAFVLGASVLYSPTNGDTQSLVHVATPVIAVTAAAMVALVAGIAWAAVRIRRMAPPRDTVGTPLLVGTPGIVQMPLGPVGTVHLGGETWSARTADGRGLDRGAGVVLVAFDGLVAIVAPGVAGPAPVRQPGGISSPASAVPPIVRP